jgi:hypothetical protein
MCARGPWSALFIIMIFHCVCDAEMHRDDILFVVTGAADL